jgi:hypothetical protein
LEIQQVSVNPNWVRWLFASVASYLKDVADDAGVPFFLEGMQARDKNLMQAKERAEVRISGPFTEEISRSCYRATMNVNVLLTGVLDVKENSYGIIITAGIFHQAMDAPIPVWNYGGQPGDFDASDPDSQSFLGCLTPRSIRSTNTNTSSVRVVQLGQIPTNNMLRQLMLDASYEMLLQGD